MAYTLPNFNILCDVWILPAKPADGPPTHVDIPCQLYRNSRLADNNSPRAQLRLSTLSSPLVPTSGSGAAGNPIVECPSGSGNFYRAERGEFMHRGFPNEYVSVDVTPCQLSGVRIDTDTTLQ